MYRIRRCKTSNLTSQSLVESDWCYIRIAVYNEKRIESRTTSLREAGMRCPVHTAHCSLLTAHCSLLTAHCSLFVSGWLPASSAPALGWRSRCLEPQRDSTTTRQPPGSARNVWKFIVKNGIFTLHAITLSWLSMGKRFLDVVGHSPLVSFNTVWSAQEDCECSCGEIKVMR